MNIGGLKAGLKILAARAGNIWHKHGPQIMVGTGIVGFIGTAVSAGSATLKADKLLTEKNEQMEKIEKARANNPESVYSKQDYENDKKIVKSKTAWGLIKLYALPVGLAATSTMLVLRGHGKMVARCSVLSAACKKLQNDNLKLLNENQQLKNGEVAEKLQETVAETLSLPSGEENKEVRPIPPKGADGYSQFAVQFNQLTSRYWINNLEENLNFIRKIESIATDRLRFKGYLWLNEVHAMLGMEETDDGQYYGWIDDPDHTVAVDLGLWKIPESKLRQDLIARYSSVMLDPNVDAVPIVGRFKTSRRKK